MAIQQFKYKDIHYEFSGHGDDHIFKWIGHPSFYEISLLEYLSSLNREGVYVDVGANIGNHSVYFANHCPSTKVISFEPERECFAYLETNMKANSTKPFELHNVGAWDENKKAYLKRFISFKNMGQSKISNIPTDYEVELVKLDDVIKEAALIKIDIEGEEARVINGAREIITRYKPVIACEAATSEEKIVLDELLETFGYSPARLRFNATPTYVWY